MKTLAAWVLAVALASGCSTRAQLHVDTGAPPRPVHGGASVGLHIESSSLAALIVAAALLGAAVGSLREEQPAPSTATAPLAPDRTVNEQDCSRPVADPYANLRCR
jgi:hypothetical protein